MIAVDTENWAKFYDSIGEIAESMEPPDAIDNEYRIWDSTGRVMDLCINESGELFVSETNKYDREGLRRALVKYLEKIKALNSSAQVPDGLEAFSLEQLIEVGRRID